MDVLKVNPSHLEAREGLLQLRLDKTIDVHKDSEKQISEVVIFYLIAQICKKLA